MSTHYRLRAGTRRGRAHLRAGLDLPPLLAEVSAHQRLRGPYTAAGTLLRQIVPDLLSRRPDVGPRYNIEILTAAPEFADRVPAIPTTLDLADTSAVRTRYQARHHSLRIAHGLVELIATYLAATEGGRRTLVVEDVHGADPSDLEFLAVLLRRIPPDRLTVVVGTPPGPAPEAPGPISESLSEALAAYTTVVDEVPSPAEEPGSDGDVDELRCSTRKLVDGLARAYVDSDGTSDDPRHLAAYECLTPQRRAELHDARGAELSARGEKSLLLGAVPYHAERGSDPNGLGVRVLRQAQAHCKDHGMFHAAADLGLRGRSLVDRDADPDLWWTFTGDTTTTLSAAGRADDAAALYDEIRGISIDPAIHMHAAYGTAMLYARHYPDEQRDPQRARIWLNLAIAIAGLLEEPKERAFYSTFNRNGLALVAVRQGRPDEALHLLNEGMARLDRDLAPGDEALHRTGLRYNRAQLRMLSGELAEALADYNAVIAEDPNFPDHYFNRGTVLRRLGRMEEAIADYEACLRLSPPFPEAYYNRGDARYELGDEKGALEDFEYTLELDPSNVDARLNRAAILAERGEDEAAWRDIMEGLARQPGHARLLCLKGRLLAERGQVEKAREALSAAIAAEPGLAEAWAVRGELAFASGDPAQAVTDLDRAVELSGAPEMRFNRAVVLEAVGRFADAAAEYDAVLELTGDPDARTKRDACLRAVAESAVAS